MNKTERMLAIILELQRNSMQRAEDLAAIFETSVRTIYRDMHALSESGVPVIGSPGQGYSLVEGYFLPPISFKAEEVVTLLLGLDFVDQLFDEGYQLYADSARKKLEGILTENVREEANQIRSGVKLDTSIRSNKNQTGIMLTLRAAVNEKKQVRFTYTKYDANLHESEQTVRVTDPYGLLFRNGTWMVIAYCHLRKEIRHFALKRMTSVELLNQTFQVPPDFELQTYAPADQRDVVVKLHFETNLAARILEYDYYYADSAEETPDGLLLTLRVHRPEEILQWVMSWGSGVTVLEPESLQEKIKMEAEKIAKRY